MRILCTARRAIPCPASAAFELSLDPARFPSLFQGYGPIPAIRSIVLDTALRVGATRRIHNADGTVLTEQVIRLDPPSRHSYSLTGFRAPFSWLVRRGDADWNFTSDASGTQVRWSYDFVVTGFWAYPIAAVLLQVFMRRAMQRCLDSMAQTLASPSAICTEAA